MSEPQRGRVVLVGLAWRLALALELVVQHGVVRNHPLRLFCVTRNHWAPSPPPLAQRHLGQAPPAPPRLAPDLPGSSPMYMKLLEDPRRVL